MAFSGPGVPSKGTPRSRARWWAAASAACAVLPPVRPASAHTSTHTSTERVIAGRGISISSEKAKGRGSGPGDHHVTAHGVPPVHRVHEHAGGAHAERL